MTEEITEVHGILVAVRFGHGMLVGIHDRDILNLRFYPFVNQFQNSSPQNNNKSNSFGKSLILTLAYDNIIQGALGNVPHTFVIHPTHAGPFLEGTFNHRRFLRFSQNQNQQDFKL